MSVNTSKIRNGGIERHYGEANQCAASVFLSWTTHFIAAAVWLLFEF
jgi:hypothetical protein